MRVSFTQLVCLFVSLFLAVHGSTNYTRVYERIFTGNITMNVGIYSTDNVISNSSATKYDKIFVLLHGYPEGNIVWDAAAKQLMTNNNIIQNNEKVLCLVPDLRGYNNTDKPASQTDYLTQHLAADVVGLINKFRNLTTSKRVYLVGHDWGGSIAYYVAHYHAQLLNALAVVSAPQSDILSHLLKTLPAQRKTLKIWLPLITTPDLTANAMAAVNYKPILAEFPPSFSVEMKHELRRAYKVNKSFHKMCYYYSAAVKSINPVPETINVTTTVIWGAEDPYLPLENLIGLDKYITNVKTIVYEKGSHYPQVDFPARIAADIYKMSTAN